MHVRIWIFFGTFCIYNKKRKKCIKSDIWMYSSFSVSIVKPRPFIGVVGILHIVQLNANKNIGIENTKGCAEEKGDFLKTMLLSSKTKFAFGTRNILEKINKTSNYLLLPIYTILLCTFFWWLSFDFYWMYYVSHDEIIH